MAVTAVKAYIYVDPEDDHPGRQKYKYYPSAEGELTVSIPYHNRWVTIDVSAGDEEELPVDVLMKGGDAAWQLFQQYARAFEPAFAVFLSEVQGQYPDWDFSGDVNNYWLDFVVDPESGRHVCPVVIELPYPERPHDIKKIELPIVATQEELLQALRGFQPTGQKES